MDTRKFLNDIQSNDADARFNAWRAAGEVDPVVIGELGRLAGSSTPGIARAAREALTTMTHSVGKDTKAPNRQAVVKGLLGLNSAALPVRIHALRLLSNIAGEDAVGAIAKDIQNPELREEVVYCLERTPGDASMEALVQAYPMAKDDFKPRILAAFGHRRYAKAAAICAMASQSKESTIAVSGLKAFARIGLSSAPPQPIMDGLTGTERNDVIDSRLRIADAQAKTGNKLAALNMYKTILERPEEHFQCAAIVGIAKLGSTDAAALILPKIKSSNRNVRITAQNAWKGMATAI